MIKYCLDTVLEVCNLGYSSSMARELDADIRKLRGRSRVTNGKSIFIEQVDGRSTLGRRVGAALRTEDVK